MAGKYTGAPPGKLGRKADSGPLSAFKGKAKGATQIKPKSGGTGISKGPKGSGGKKR
jgi:hypothetical protein